MTDPVDLRKGLQFVWWWPVITRVDDDGSRLFMLHHWLWGFKPFYGSMGKIYRWSFWLGLLEIRKWAR